MPYMHMLSDPGMNYTLNRPLLDGTSPARIKEIGAVAPQIKDYESWHAVWLGLAKRAEAEKRWLDAASYYHGAEFYLPAGEVRNGLYDDFARNWALGMKGVAAYERIAVPYRGGHLPGFRVQAKGKELSTFVFNGGYDSFVEEFYAFLLPLTDLGFTVIGFDGPGQGGALRQGIYFEHAWEKPAKAVLDYFKLDAVDWLGASCGGYLSIRAAAFEPRIRHIISLPTTYSGLDVTLKQMTPGKAQQLVSLFKAGDRKGTEALVAEQRTPSSVFDWCITQGMHITGSRTAFDFLIAIAQHSLDGILHNVKQDILLTEGEQDHLFDIDWLYRTMRELVCARSVTARIFTAREGAEQHLPGRQLGACARGSRPLACALLSRHAVDQTVKLSPLFAGALSAAIIAGVTVWTFAQVPGLLGMGRFRRLGELRPFRRSSRVPPAWYSVLSWRGSSRLSLHEAWSRSQTPLPRCLPLRWPRS